MDLFTEKTDEELVWWHHCLNRHDYEQVLGDGEGQRSLACHSPWGRKEIQLSEDSNIYVLMYHASFPLSDFTLYNRLLSSSTSLQLTTAPSLLWLSNIPLYLHTTSSLLIHLLMGTWVAFMSRLLCSISLPPGVHASLCAQAEQAMIILLPPKIQIIMNSSVNPLLLRPVLGTALGTDSVLAQDEALYGMGAVRLSCSWPFPLWWQLPYL